MRVEGIYKQTSGASRGENARLCLDVIARSESDEAIHSCCPWIASWSLSSGALPRDPLARNDGYLGCLKLKLQCGCALGARSPPLRGRAGEGGSHAHRPCGSPPSLTLPHKGGGNMSASCREIAKYVSTSLRGTKRRSNPFFFVARWIASLALAM